MSLIDYLCGVIGVSFDELAELSAGQLLVVICGCIISVFVLIFIFRAVLGASTFWWR